MFTITFLKDRFLSTPSGWRATCFTRATVRGAHISLHALRVEGDSGGNADFIQHVRISIHALRVEGDLLLLLQPFLVVTFLSTPSGWRATAKIFSKGIDLSISIHALRVEGDHCE